MVWGCISAFGPGKFPLTEGRMNGKMYQDDQDEMRVVISVRQLSQTHSQGNSRLVSEKENKVARMARPVT